MPASLGLPGLLARTGCTTRRHPAVGRLYLFNVAVLLRLGWRGQHSPAHTEDHKPNVMQSLKTTSRRHVLAQPDLCSEDGFNQGKISGTIRDYTGAKSAQKQFGDNPKWIVRYGNERTLYDKAHAPD
jgi:hypothetical protein